MQQVSAATFWVEANNSQHWLTFRCLGLSGFLGENRMSNGRNISRARARILLFCCGIVCVCRSNGVSLV